MTPPPTERLWRADGEPYDVPYVRLRAGESPDAGARRAGGVIPSRAARGAAEDRGEVIAWVEGGYPVVREALP